MTPVALFVDFAWAFHGRGLMFVKEKKMKREIQHK